MAECSSSAKQALDKLREQLTCPICLEQFTDPKLLQCFHVFCEKCLKAVAHQTPQGQVVECPSPPPCPRKESLACREHSSFTTSLISKTSSRKCPLQPIPSVSNARRGRPHATVVLVDSFATCASNHTSIGTNFPLTR